VRKVFVRTSMIVALTTMTAGLASAQTAYVLPETSQATTLTAAVSEQAQIAVPSAVNFAVTDGSGLDCVP
jgi:hypothetical protein